MGHCLINVMSDRHLSADRNVTTGRLCTDSSLERMTKKLHILSKKVLLQLFMVELVIVQFPSLKFIHTHTQKHTL